jgi:hypothetical protein
VRLRGGGSAAPTLVELPSSLAAVVPFPTAAAEDESWTVIRLPNGENSSSSSSAAAAGRGLNSFALRKRGEESGDDVGLVRAATRDVTDA